MKIFNIRYGLACNSSSSHSILLINDNKEVKTDEYSDFGWNYFTANDLSSKRNYLYYTVAYALDGYENKEKMLEKFFGQSEPSGYIDHQSVLVIPRKFNGQFNEEFVEDFIQYISNTNVVIVGGNDNDDKEHKLKDKYSEILANYPKEEDALDWIARKDKNYWTVFNKKNGAKIRFSLDPFAQVTKATSPELADIKITDYCPYACDYCYQDSTQKGKHASLDNIKFIANELMAKEVFEVALGGGETTLHPDFLEILKIFNKKGIVTNFTTRNYQLFKQSNIDEILTYTGSIAFSVSSKKDIEKIKTNIWDSNSKKIDRGYNQRDLLCIQYVMGSTKLEELKEIIKEASLNNYRLTLLGYKQNGRGENFIPEDYSNWLNIVLEVMKELEKDNLNCDISIDTALAAQYKKELLEHNVDEKTFHTTEGNFSIYIDAVNNTMHPSSYTGLEKSFKFDKNWISNYENLGVEAPIQKPQKTIKIIK